MIVRIPVMPDLSSDRDDKIRVIGHVVNSFGEGKNVLWMPRELVNYLIESRVLGEYNQRVLYKLKQFVVGAKSFHEKFDFHLEISFDSERGVDNEGGGKIVVGYKQALDSLFWQPPRLVVEDLDDSGIYHFGGVFHLIKNRLYDVCAVRFDCRHGGGSRTFEQFEIQLSDKAPVLCILDSDKSHPNGSLGGTAKRFSSYRRGLNGLYFLKVLESKEIENVIPINILIEAIPAERRSVTERFLYIVGEGYRRYFDHKEGLRLEEAVDADARHGLRYWGGLASRFEGQEWICKGVGINISKLCLDYIEGRSFHKSCEKVDEVYDQEWGRVSNIVAAWGVCVKRVTR